MKKCFYNPFVQGIFICFLILQSSSLSNAQSNDNDYVPKLVPPSPEAAEFVKYGQYPVSMSTGIPSIEIPIHTIHSRQIDVPVSVSYHASGIKVDEIPSPAGLGWLLNGGGVITRTVKGLADDYFGITNFIEDEEFLNNLNTPGDKFEHLYTCATAPYDTESDIYNFNFNGYSGEFRFDITGEIIQLPKSELKVEYDYDHNRFLITDPQGLMYVFSEKEETRTGVVGSNEYSTWYISAWYLTSITSADSTDIINFTYLTDSNIYEEQTESYSIRECKPANGTIPCNYSPTVNYTFTRVEHRNTKYLSQINFYGGQLEVSYSADRIDRRKYRINQIAVRNYEGTVIKNTQLRTSYFTPYSTTDGSGVTPDNDYHYHTNYRLKLDGIDFINSDNVVEQSHDFDYNTTKYLPAYIADYIDYQNSNHPARGKDYWGYYNGIQTNKNLITLRSPSYQGSIANRSINEEYAKACILTKIHYPTGGFTEFKYESNSRDKGELAGGLRIKEILSYANDQATPLTKSYIYENALDNFFDYGNIAGLVFTKGIDYYCSLCHLDCGPNYCKKQLFDNYVSSPLVPMSLGNSPSEFYGKVTEYDGKISDNNGKTITTFERYGKDIKYSFPNGSLPQNFIPKVQYAVYSHNWLRGQVKSKSVYRNDGNSYVLIKNTTNNYQVLDDEERVVGFESFMNYDYPYEFVPIPTSNLGVDELFQYRDILITTGIKKLVQSIDTEYSPTGEISTVTTTEYDNLEVNYQPSSITTETSDGSIRKIEFKYVNDFQSPENVYDQMIQNHIISPIISKESYYNDNLLESIKFNYKNWGNNIFKVENIQKKRSGVTYSLVDFINYDGLGRPISIKKTDENIMTYLWDPELSYPIAEIQNALNDEIAYSGFETTYHGNWNYQENTSIESKSGNYSFEGSTVSKENIPTNRYRIGFWVKAETSGGTLVINGHQFSFGNDWEYFVYQTDEVDAINITIQGVKIDDLYLIPYNAHIKMLGYKPMVGTSSVTDSNGNLVSYDYDRFNRLSIIKNRNNDIVKYMQYNYQSK